MEQPVEKKAKKSALAELFEEEDKVITTQVDEPEPGNIRALKEVNDYRAIHGITTDGDPLHFWQMNQLQFPMLSQMATKYLCVQGSSVPSERVFSSAGDILRKERANLDPDLADILIFLKMNTD